MAQLSSNSDEARQDVACFRGRLLRTHRRRRLAERLEEGTFRRQVGCRDSEGGKAVDQWRLNEALTFLTRASRHHKESSQTLA